METRTQRLKEARSQWGSKIGFILAASGSAIGLGNIVFFSANAYKFGGGAFYIPYLVALVVIGLPLMILELALGTHTGRALPQSLHSVAGRVGEFFGWFAVLNATIITMYYTTILGWVVGMLVGSLGSLWNTNPVTTGTFGALGLPNPFGYFFEMLGSWNPIVYVGIVWTLSTLIVSKGAKSIEAATRWIVPLMWVCMIALIVRGLTLPNGEHGLYLLFNPDFTVMKNPAVWKGAFSQMFFTLSLGFGIMTAYASYLPKDSDQVHNAATISFLNCSFEFIAGLAIFSLLFAYAVVPKASTLSMMFFVVPQGIGNLPHFVQEFGVLFFFLLMIAGLSSAVSLVESSLAAFIDKFQWRRKWAMLLTIGAGVVGSLLFALPKVIDPGLDGNGTLGLTLLDIFDHWAFSYGLLIAGLAECILVGWIFGAKKLAKIINRSSTISVGTLWILLIQFVIPFILAVVIGWGIVTEVRTGLYGSGMAGADSLNWMSFAGWIVFTVGLSAILTLAKGQQEGQA